MIKVKVSNDLKHIIIKGHANFSDYGSDIVCASVSSIVTTSINACLSVNEKSLTYKESEGFVEINVLDHDEIIIKLINNMLAMLSELATTYKKNINIIKED